MVKVGDRVQCPFDDGWHGTIIYGTVVKAGPIQFTVRWESGIENRVRQDDVGGEWSTGLRRAREGGQE